MTLYIIILFIYPVYHLKIDLKSIWWIIDRNPTHSNKETRNQRCKYFTRVLYIEYFNDILNLLIRFWPYINQNWNKEKVWRRTTKQIINYELKRWWSNIQKVFVPDHVSNVYLPRPIYVKIYYFIIICVYYIPFILYKILFLFLF